MGSLGLERTFAMVVGGVLVLLGVGGLLGNPIVGGPEDTGIFVTGFGYPVVPEGTARLRVQASAALGREDMDRALRAFARVGSEVGLL